MNNYYFRFLVLEPTSYGQYLFRHYIEATGGIVVFATDIANAQKELDNGRINVLVIPESCVEKATAALENKPYTIVTTTDIRHSVDSF